MIVNGKSLLTEKPIIDMRTPHHCIYAKHIQAKEQCEYWRVIASDVSTQKEEP